MFDKPSTRTRVSFETGVYELGGHPLVLRQGELQLARGESPRDTALVLSRMVHALAVRTGPHETVEELARWSGVPVINMLTHEHHPCQALADLMTLLERFGRLEGLKLAYVGDGNNMARSLLLGGASPAWRWPWPPPRAVAARGSRRGSGRGGARAHAVYTDVWVSMGDEQDASGAARCSRPTASTPSSWPRHARTRSSSTACRPTRARRSRGSALRRALGRLGSGREPAARQKALLELLSAGKTGAPDNYLSTVRWCNWPMKKWLALDPRLRCARVWWWPDAGRR